MTFCPPMSLMNSEESIVGFRRQQADQNLRMLTDLQYKELERLENEISATMASLRVHYESPLAWNYNIEDALNFLATFMQRAKEVESAELNKKFTSFMQAPKAALWVKFPPQVTITEDAIKPRKNNNSAGQKPNALIQGQERRDKGFQQAGRNAWGPTRGRDPRNFRGQGPRRGQGHMRGQGHVSQSNKRNTLQQMFNLLADILQ